LLIDSLTINADEGEKPHKCTFRDIKYDITKTDSILAPYRASVNGKYKDSDSGLSLTWNIGIRNGDLSALNGLILETHRVAWLKGIATTGDKRHCNEPSPNTLINIEKAETLRNCSVTAAAR
jgi:hypothetical protein